jgi:hypothetical protein
MTGDLCLSLEADEDSLRREGNVSVGVETGDNFEKLRVRSSFPPELLEILREKLVEFLIVFEDSSAGCFCCSHTSTRWVI